MNATGKRRLLKLADFLETADLPGEFDMTKWGTDGSVTDGRPKCGSAACAFGWATVIPSFRRAGLTMDQNSLPNFGGRSGWRAAVKFFDISEDQETSLFEPDDMERLKGKRGRNTVARRIRKLVASKAA